MKPSLIFFGSFGHYSSLVLKELLVSNLVKVKHVVTTPPAVDRKGTETKGAVQIFAQEENIPVTTKMPTLFSDISPDFSADFIITAGYGKLLPPKLLSEPKIASLNLHFSLLPKYRGANPGEWAILMGEKESGTTVIEMNEEFDKGGIVSSLKKPITPAETRESLYEKLYRDGGKTLPQVIVDFADKKLLTKPQPKTNFPYATRFKRYSGFISWEVVKKNMDGINADLNEVSPLLASIAQLQNLDSIPPYYVERASRALYNFPSLWTFIPTSKGEKRMKIHSTLIENDKLILNEVQIEGQSKALFNQVKNIIE
ncbi:MAG: methionyl-tRNA formyltransferase [Candidatus Pacebacteria bacterium]|nr:methionyl-tRNA formyltransferase [Candidatus Paceibacterota bacterium]